MALTKVSGSVLKNPLSLSGNVSVGGTLTYEDVTNVDAIGIITARSGINVSGGQIEVGSNIKIGNAGVITATSFVGSGANLTGLNSDLVNDTSPQLGGNLDTNSHNIFLDDDHKVIFGNDQSADLHIFHESSSGTGNIYNATGELRIRTNDLRLKNLGNSETYLRATNNGAVELYHANAKKLETSSGGITITGQLTTTGNINLGDDDRIVMGDAGQSDSHIRWDTSVLHLASAGKVRMSCGGLKVNNLAGTATILDSAENGAVQLYHNNNLRFQTTSTGVSVIGSIDANDNCKLLLGDGDDLQIDHSGTNSQIYHNGTGHLYIAALGSSENIILQSVSGDLKFSAGGSERLKIDSNGYVTKAAHPSFCARYQSGDGYVSTNIFRLTGINNDNFTWNTGGHYSTSTGKFTAPVAGVYFFEGQAMTTGHSNGDNIQDMMELRTNNGLVTYCRQRRTYFRSDADANGYYVNGTSGQVNLAVGDTVWFQRRSGLGYSYGNSHYTYFTGWLIG